LSNKVIKAIDVKLIEGPGPVGAQGPSVGTQRELRKSGLTRKSGEFPSHERGVGNLADVVAKAKREAYEKGFSEGAESRKREITQALSAMVAATRETSELKKKLYEEAEGQMLQLIFSIVEKVIHMEVSTNKGVVLEVLRQATKNVVSRDSMKIHMNPADHRFIMELKPELLQEMNWLKNAIFEEDSSIKPGGVILETKSGEVDARLEQQLKEIKSSFKI
jgi:flagellar assembly protein FliH